MHLHGVHALAHTRIHTSRYSTHTCTLTPARAPTTCAHAGQIAEAVRDCDKALEREPRYVKALLRRYSRTLWVGGHCQLHVCCSMWALTRTCAFVYGFIQVLDDGERSYYRQHACMHKCVNTHTLLHAQRCIRTHTSLSHTSTRIQSRTRVQGERIRATATTRKANGAIPGSSCIRRQSIRLRLSNGRAGPWVRSTWLQSCF